MSRPVKRSNLIHTLSTIKLQNMQSTNKARFWKRRGAGSSMSLISTQSNSQDGKILVGIEEEFLHAAEFGDIPTVKRVLAENPDLNVDCIDALGRTALRLAVKNEHLEVVEVLLTKSSSRHIYEAVLQAISASHVQIAENILKHKRYLELWKERKKLGDDDHFFKTQFEESQFSPDITPLILASQKNQYEIVQLLLLRGEKVQKPHKFGCLCQECVNKMKFDQLRSARYRLNAYRGLASEAYISLSSKDPILTAFRLSKELQNLSTSEKYFKLEYGELVNELSEYVVKLLDRVRTQEELELVLNKTGKANVEKYSTLARLHLALQYMEKKFVAHPSCQQRLDKSWAEGIGPFRKATIFKKIWMTVLFVLTYPFLTLIYLVMPNANFKLLRVMAFPWIKFAFQSMSFISFLALIVVSTAGAGITHGRLSADYPDVFAKYTVLRNLSAVHSIGYDVPIRQALPTITQLLISLWVLGFLYQECTQIFGDGVAVYCESLYNLMDFTLLVGYFTAFTLRYLVMLKLHIALDYYTSTSTASMLANPEESRDYLYWITADRFHWDTWDPINLSEGAFAIANILSFSRISYLLPASEALGPLQISLGRMIKDILKFMALFIVVLLAFMIGLQNLYWYYTVRDTIEIEKHMADVPAETHFGDIVKTFRTVFWSLFGRGEPNVVTLGDYENHVTEDLGYIIYGVYNLVAVTVLLNMLIAMMARSFQAVTEESDVEWKFARSQLYMDYISNASVLPVPLNLLRIPRAMFEWCCDYCDDSADDVKEEEDEAPAVANGAMPDIAMKRKRMREMPLRNSPSGSVDAGDIYHANNSPFRVTKQNSDNTTTTDFRRPSISAVLDERKTYQKVMQRIIQRYIFDVQREAEVTEDDLEEIKQDVSSFRYELMNVIQSRQAQVDEIQVTLTKIGKVLENLSGVSTMQRSHSMMDTSRRHVNYTPRKQRSFDDKSLDDSAIGELQEDEMPDIDDGGDVDNVGDGDTDGDVGEAKESDIEECIVVEEESRFKREF